jgi:soluble lytic murein transglycosylase-like protein
MLGIDPNNPDQAAYGGMTYLSQLRWKFGDLAKALAAYNGVGSQQGGDAVYKKFGGLDNLFKQHPKDWENYVSPGERRYIDYVAGTAPAHVTITINAPPGFSPAITGNQLANGATH